METKSQKIFTNKAISVATFFGGPVAAGFLIAKNYKTFGNPGAARNSVFIGILSTILIFAGIFMIPEDIIDKIPQQLIPLIYTAIIAGLVDLLQGQKIKEFLENNGQKASNWLAAGYGLLGLAVIAVFLAGMFFAVPMDGYEKSIPIDKNVNLIFSKDFDELKSQQIADAIKLTGFMEGSGGADLFLSSEDGFYKLKFVIPDPSVLSDSTLVDEFNGLKNFLNYNLNLDKKIEIGFTNLTLQHSFDLPEVPFDDPYFYEPLLYLQPFPISDRHIIFCDHFIPFEDVKKVESTVKKLSYYFPADQQIAIVFINTGPDYTIKFFVDKVLWQDEGVTERLKSTVDYIKKSGITKHINLVFIDNQTFEEKLI